MVTLLALCACATPPVQSIRVARRASPQPLLRSDAKAGSSPYCTLGVSSRLPRKVQRQSASTPFSSRAPDGVERGSRSRAVTDAKTSFIGGAAFQGLVHRPAVGKRAADGSEGVVGRIGTTKHGPGAVEIQHSVDRPALACRWRGHRWDTVIKKDYSAVPHPVIWGVHRPSANQSYPSFAHMSGGDRGPRQIAGLLQGRCALDGNREIDLSIGYEASIRIGRHHFEQRSSC